MSQAVADQPASLTPPEMEEALHPELSDETFTIGTQTFQLRELPNFYERKIIRVGGDILANLEKMTTVELFEEFVGRLPRVVAVMVYAVGGFGVDPGAPWNTQKFEEIATWVERSACSSSLITIVARQAQKNGLADRVGETSAQGLIKQLVGSLSTLLSPASSKPTQA